MKKTANEYLEIEWKVLGVNVPDLCTILERMGALKVFDEERIVTSFDDSKHNLIKSSKHLKVTEEEKVKISFSQPIGKNSKEEVKFKTERKKEVFDFLKRLGYLPIARSKSKRISYEWNGIDFDIDTFPQIDPFLEIDLGDSNKTLDNILKKLELLHLDTVQMSTPEIYEFYGKDYFKIFAIEKR